MVSIMFERELNATAFDDFRLHRVLTFVQSISYKKENEFLLNRISPKLQFYLE